MVNFALEALSKQVSSRSLHQGYICLFYSRDDLNVLCDHSQQTHLIRKHSDERIICKCNLYFMTEKNNYLSENASNKAVHKRFMFSSME